MRHLGERGLLVGFDGEAGMASRAIAAAVLQVVVGRKIVPVGMQRFELRDRETEPFGYALGLSTA